MNVLVLEVSQKRQAWFRHHLGESSIVCFMVEAEAELESRTWDAVFIGTCHGNRTADVVDWIVQHRPRVKEFIVHYPLPHAAREMTNKLIGAGYVACTTPFITFNGALK